eukprot:TRINITY_DN5634_c0_g2_i3.p3 TRINITY_DN5634_c0_g2~~TRINITY_DN5634_c0_g2_i3.p3  ORF type:complete len:111 (-),score=20.31 TRINITY_DN5634_c0_g2_i3:415-747(-)
MCIRDRSNESSLVIQNKLPSALYVLPPGQMKIKFTQEVKGMPSDFLHLGGWAIVHTDNTCEINLVDLVEKQTVKPDQFEKGNYQDTDDISGKYASKLRKQCAKLFQKYAA